MLRNDIKFLNKKILGTNLEMANLIDLENFADVGYHHFIKLLLSKLKQVRVMNNR